MPAVQAIEALDHEEKKVDENCDALVQDSPAAAATAVAVAAAAQQEPDTAEAKKRRKLRVLEGLEDKIR